MVVVVVTVTSVVVLVLVLVGVSFDVSSVVDVSSGSLTEDSDVADVWIPVVVAVVPGVVVAVAAAVKLAIVSGGGVGRCEGAASGVGRFGRESGVTTGSGV